MSKRKREDEKDSEVLTVGKARRSFDPILERSKQALFRALKLARGFERQKLGRRQKVAQKATDAVSEQRLAAEVAVLKVSYNLSLEESCLRVTTELGFEYLSGDIPIPVTCKDPNFSIYPFNFISHARKSDGGLEASEQCDC